MNAIEKIERLMKLRNIPGRTELARQIGAQPRWVSDLLNAGNEPGVRRAHVVAARLGVDPGWLWDDNRDWPPPDAANTVTLTADERLILDITRRIGAEQALVKLVGVPSLPAQPAAPAALTPTGPTVGVPTDASPAAPPRRGKGRRDGNHNSA